MGGAAHLVAAGTLKGPAGRLRLTQCLKECHVGTVAQVLEQCAPIVCVLVHAHVVECGLVLFVAALAEWCSKSVSVMG